jgi:putative methyltransferase (TIGR04325 family)
MNIRDFLPPIIFKLKSKLFNNNKNSSEKKVFESYKDAQLYCTNDDYQNTELCNVIADKTLIFRNQLKNETSNLNATNVFLLAAILNETNNYQNKLFTVLDFGGACGTHYFEIRKYLPASLNLKWIVVETEQMVKSATEKKIHNNELIFTDSLNDLPYVDFLYSSCAIQYTSNPYLFLEELLKLGAKSILFNRMMFNENDKDIVTIQKSFLSENGPGSLPEHYTDKLISYPHTTLSFRKFSQKVLQTYRLNWMFNESTGTLKIVNESIIGRGLFYSKKIKI